ncbi:Retrovirus-related Pol polyprotein from transposon opus [Quillaja saponaria]|uniref:Retrovirus-related Pol polyprotein from transposon opus n=1 Tax=Quillaja saponaria TaxID=32244 RepID=A0AAD7LKM8_QUISA|nr:Retrovirus-related Pol polyprotein from transposon opus [Quillaja saponaria]
MCVDFTYLNEACPKDSFPLPRIDRLVDSSSGNELLSFIDAYAGYNQTKLAEEDEEKTSFIIETGTYCFKVMLFSFKNACATYQHLVNRIFKAQMGRNVEVYVDDMLIKSPSLEEHVKDLRKTFSTINHHQLKLNPTKCTFRVSSGKFPGFIMTIRGIEANPSKITVVFGMQNPKSTKEVQRLTGQITALAQFISKLVVRCFPFFQTLKKAFLWTRECEMAFQWLKEYLASVLVLGKLIDGEVLILYLGASAVAVSSVLLRRIVFSSRNQVPTYREDSLGFGKFNSQASALLPGPQCRS